MQRLEQLSAALINSLGFEFWGMEICSLPKAKVIRIYIDAPEGITLNDCEKVSKPLLASLRAETPDFLPNCSFEVSSPGLDRRLFTLEQCKRYLGQKLQFKIRGKSHPATGKLCQVSQDSLLIETSNGRELFLFADLAVVKILPVWD